MMPKLLGVVALCFAGILHAGAQTAAPSSSEPQILNVPTPPPESAQHGQSAQPAQPNQAAKPTQAAQATQPAQSAHPATEAQVKEYLEVTGTTGRVEKNLAQVVTVIRSKAPAYFPASVWEDVGAGLRSIDVVKACLPAFQGAISEQDMAAVLAFFRTEPGKRYALAQGPILGGTQTLLNQQIQSVVQAAITKHKDEIEAAKKAAEAGQTAPEPK